MRGVIPLGDKWIDEIGSKQEFDLIKRVEIGGIYQWIRLRGKDVKKPVILFLHGGPGFAHMSFAHKFQSKLEDEFVVVNWDQRGAGKSYSNDIDIGSMNIDQFILDTYQVANILLHALEKEKIYLTGLSWGASIGTYTIFRYPELFYAFIPCGYGIEYYEVERSSFEFVLNTARITNNKKALSELEKFSFPPSKERFNEFCNIKGKWLMKFGGYIKSSVPRLLLKALPSLLFSPVYSLNDRLKWYKGLKFSAETAGNLIMKINFFEEVPKIEVPIYICVGKYDYLTSYEVTVKYFEQLEAPLKELIWFENSAHAPNFEESNKFCDVLINMVLPGTYNK